MKLYPVAEQFHSIQGEGLHSGRLMHFIRLAGCNVGLYAKRDQLVSLMPTEQKYANELADAREANPLHSVCCTAIGQHFICDTDYHSAAKWSAKDLCLESYEGIMCITGGEPFLHDLQPFVDTPMQLAGLIMEEDYVHIETSGTIAFPQWLKNFKRIESKRVWVTCSPKKGFLPDNTFAVDEWKFVVSDKDIDGGAQAVADRIAKFFEDQELGAGVLNMTSFKPIYIQSVNGIDEVDKAVAQFAYEVVKLGEGWRLGVQLHKYLGLR